MERGIEEGLQVKPPSGSDAKAVVKVLGGRCMWGWGRVRRKPSPTDANRKGHGLVELRNEINLQL